MSPGIASLPVGHDSAGEAKGMTRAELARISPVTIERRRATAAIEEVLQTAAGAGIPYTISVIDAGGHLVTLVREDGAALASIDTSQSKARTALFFAQPT